MPEAGEWQMDGVTILHNKNSGIVETMDKATVSWTAKTRSRKATRVWKLKQSLWTERRQNQETDVFSNGLDGKVPFHMQVQNE